MRFYIHHEEDEPTFCLPVEWSDADTRPVEALLQHFIAAFARKGGKGTQLQLASSDGTPIPSKARVLAVVEDGGDIFAVRAAAPAPSAKAPAASSTAASNAPDAVQKVLAPYLDAARKAWDKRQYRQARDIYKELVGVHAKLPIALRRLGEIELLCDRAEAATEWLLKAAQAAPKDAEVRGLRTGIQ